MLNHAILNTNNGGMGTYNLSDIPMSHWHLQMHNSSKGCINSFIEGIGWVM